DFPYIDSLFAGNLDFQAVKVGTTRSLASPMHSATNARDTVTVYNYEWVSGDTANFVLLGGLDQSVDVLPGRSIPIPFQFRPTAPRPYVATLRVWSNAINPVTITLQGMGIAPALAVVPDTIDFGRVRLGTKRDGQFVIENLGTIPISLTDLAYQESITDTDFTADPFKTGAATTIPVPVGGTQSDSVHFIPHTLGLHTSRIPIWWTYQGAATSQDTPAVVLRGIGVEPNVSSTGYAFGALRVDTPSKFDTIAIVNRGSDVTAVDSVTIVTPLALTDFTVNLDSLPPKGPRAARLGYEGTDTAVNFTVQFQPRSLGLKQLILRIHTIDGDVIYDTITGTGVEPLVRVAPDTLDFGTISVPMGTTLLKDTSLSFTVTNTGTMQAFLDSLQYDASRHFSVTLNKPGAILDEAMDTAVTLTGTVTFHVVEEGDFVDTLRVANDTRYGIYGDSLKNYQPAVLLRARVRTGPIGPDSLDFGTITTCDPTTDTVLILNPYPVEVHIDSIALLDDTGGFSLPTNIIPQISLPPNGSFALPIIFAFPPDSLNGIQKLTLGLFQRRLNGDVPIVDTVSVTVIRKQRVFTLHAHLPSFASSANDVFDLKLPITVEGPRAGVSELDSWSLSLRFSNDLFEPVGIDTAGALTVPDSTGTFTLDTLWDQSTRTYTIVVTGSAVSDPAKIANDLLLSILMRAYLTKDTTVTVTPTFTWAHHPCAYNLQSFTLSIPYADECGDPTIRAFMRGDNPFFTVIGTRPNPTDGTGDVSIDYQAAEPSLIHCEVDNELGETVSTIESNAAQGSGTLTLAKSMLPHSGAAWIRIQATPTDGGMPVVKTVKVEIAR
ncbi:MAG: choice-of-anchor D domain-containing protein, partial [Acidobacteriaceae bacterium]